MVYALVQASICLRQTYIFVLLVLIINGNQ